MVHVVHHTYALDTSYISRIRERLFLASFVLRVFILEQAWHQLDCHGPVVYIHSFSVVSRERNYY